MSISKELLEIAQRGTLQIADAHNRSQERTSRHIVRATRVFLLMGVLLLIGQVIFQRRVESRIGQPLDAVVQMAAIIVEPTQANPILCPGDTLRYELALQILEPSVVDLDTSVRNLDTLLTVIPSETRRIIYDQAGEARLPASWRIPLVIPASGSQMMRPWVPGQYRRMVALTGVEGAKKASVVTVDFRIGTECKEIQ